MLYLGFSYKDSITEKTYILLLLLSLDSRACWNKIFIFPCILFRYSMSLNIFPVLFPQHGLSGFLSGTFTIGVAFFGKSLLIARIGVDGHGENWAMAPGSEDSFLSSLSASIKRGLMVMPLRLWEAGTSYNSGSLARLSFWVEEWHHSGSSVSVWINSSPLKSISSSSSLLWSLMFLMTTSSHKSNRLEWLLIQVSSAKADPYCQLKCKGIHKPDSTIFKNWQTRPNYIPMGNGMKSIPDIVLPC